MAEEPHDIHLVIGNEELVIRRLYQTLSIVNDIGIGLIFLIGSFMFFGESTMTAGTVLFVIGSALMLIRPCIRIGRQVHLKRIGSKDPTDSALGY
ncbi:YrhK family protein [Ruania rhizosphaerae]|uniref:YrhK family protein n=1 Tax=Ruania rhizosphaerae TaxID=1840413 RepID=UPI0013570933|nr:YrhK family protein [Ruania rhizosphaerae]